MIHLIKNIGRLVGTHNPKSPLRGQELSHLPFIDNAYLLIEDGLICELGKMDDLYTELEQNANKITDLNYAWLFPSWCDSHTHLVFSHWRENEFVYKLQGKSYAEIAAMGGGIHQSAKKVQEATEDFLFEKAWDRLLEVIQQGTGAIEIKSGYGLTLEAELKMLRIIKRLAENSPIPIKSTFLAAHAIPVEYKDRPDQFIDEVCNVWIPKVASKKLCDYIDVFCETGFFSPEQTIRVLNKAAEFGIKGKVHANQLNISGGVEAAIECNALSADHLESMSFNQIHALGQSNVIGTVLPGAAQFLRLPFPPAQELIKANTALAIATDYNPGSCPSGNMNQMISMACIQMKMLPEQAILAASINGAFAMELNNEVGSFAIGKRANGFSVENIDSFAYLPYRFGNTSIKSILLSGEWLN